MYLKIAAGSSHSVGIKKHSTLWAWGYYHYGQSGIGTTVDENVPILIGFDFASIWL